MNRIIIFLSEEIDKNTFKISSRDRIAHMATILKIQKGDIIQVSIIDKGIGRAQVLSYNPQEIILLVLIPIITPPLPKTHLFVGLSRPGTMKKILEHATSMGVTSFTFFTAQKSELSYGDSKVFEKENIQRLLLSGISQSAHLFKIPQVTVLKSSLFNFMQKEHFETSFLLSLHGEFLSPHPPRPLSNLSLTIGPERGWTEKEEEHFKELGLIPKKISPHILRVEIATFAALSQIEILRRT